VLVTGSTGFIGRRIVDRLREAGFEVRIASRHPDRVGHAGDVVPMPGFDAPEDAFLAPMSGVTHVVHAAAQNNDRDTVNGGTGPGATDLDLANIDGIDVASALASTLASAARSGGVNLGGPGGGGLNTTGPKIIFTGHAGDLDPSYGTGGKVSGPNLGWTPRAAAVDSQGRVVYVGTLFFHDNGSGYGDDFVVARYNANGTVDTGFGSGGQQTPLDSLL